MTDRPDQPGVAKRWLCMVNGGHTMTLDDIGEDIDDGVVWFKCLECGYSKRMRILDVDRND